MSGVREKSLRDRIVWWYRVDTETPNADILFNKLKYSSSTTILRGYLMHHHPEIMLAEHWTHRNVNRCVIFGILAQITAVLSETDRM